jgi:hypothetical protein
MRRGSQVIGEGRCDRECDADRSRGVPSGSPWIKRSVPLSIKYDRQSIEWYTHNGRLVSRGARNQKPDGNRDIRYKIYTGLGRQRDIKILCPVLCYFVLIGYEIW